METTTAIKNLQQAIIGLRKTLQNPFTAETLDVLAESVISLEKALEEKKPKK